MPPYWKRWEITLMPSSSQSVIQTCSVMPPFGSSGKSRCTVRRTRIRRLCGSVHSNLFSQHFEKGKTKRNDGEHRHDSLLNTRCWYTGKEAGLSGIWIQGGSHTQFASYKGIYGLCCYCCREGGDTGRWAMCVCCVCVSITFVRTSANS